jgi:protein-tyrosine phosphatase
MLARLSTNSPKDFVAGKVLLRGASNFRDLGGYETADGQRTRCGQLYRSSDLSGLTATDLAILARLNLKAVIDFRPKPDRDSRPDRLPRNNSPTVVCLPVGFNPMDPARLRSVILRGRIEDGAFSNLLKEANRAYVNDFRDEFARFLLTLSDPTHLPAVFHCTEGKDRTGFAAAIVLLAVGVPFETVLRDYLLTNQHTVRSRRWNALRVFVGTLFRVRPNQMGPLLEARPEYLEAAFDAMKDAYGSVDGYLTEGLGVNKKTRESLRALLLE